MRKISRVLLILCASVATMLPIVAMDSDREIRKIESDLLRDAMTGNVADMALWLKICESRADLVHDLTSMLNCRDEKGNTPLILAARKGNLAVIKFLAARPEVDFNAVNDDKKSALVYAAARGNTLVVRRLLEYGACGQLDEALALATHKGYDETAKLLYLAAELLKYVTPLELRKIFVDASQESFDLLMGRLNQRLSLGGEPPVSAEDMYE
jgi:ankyrin repeat protein